jgi:TolA-binding protein
MQKGVTRIVSSLIQAGGARSDVIAWALVLPLLTNASGGNLTEWRSVLDDLNLSPAQAHLLQMYCLLDMDSLPAALAIAEWRTAREGRALDSRQYCLDVAGDAEAKSRPDVAWKLLRFAADAAGYKTPAGAEMRAKMVAVASRAGKYALAMGEAHDIEIQFAGTKPARLAAFYEALCLSKMGKHAEALGKANELLRQADLDDLKGPVLFLKWYSLAESGSEIKAEEAADEFLKECPNDDRAANILYWKGVMALSKQNYDTAFELFSALQIQFRGTTYAKRAQDTMLGLSKAGLRHSPQQTSGSQALP